MDAGTELGGREQGREPVKSLTERMGSVSDHLLITYKELQQISANAVGP